MQKEHPGAFE
ncbi:Glutathione S-transferase 6 [Zea mays]|uniref:Glutathione S-transferase 6 n=1 Tax=Zea mays TaxID=4577 RepID=A0A1D6JMY1_MAIZE|nr:Glutathione S-transferase 6 [Zea mays]